MDTTGGGGGFGEGGSKADLTIGTNLHNKFVKLQFLNFRGTMNPSELDEWIRKLDLIFKTITPPEEYKIGLVTHLFTREADHWRDFVKPSDEEEEKKTH